MGCANNISKQIAAQPLKRYTYMLSLATAAANVPIYGAVLFALVKSGAVPRYQFEFVWRARRGLPCIVFFAIAAFGDTLGDVITILCTPYVSGPINSLTSNCTTIWIAALATCILGSRYSVSQCLGLVCVLVAVILGILPSFDSKGAGETNPFFAVVLSVDCIFYAVSFIIKEIVFRRYDRWAESTGQNEDGRGSGLHIFMMNTHLALFEFPLTLLVVPLNEAFGQTNGEGIVSYMGEAFTCVFGGTDASCGQDSHGGQFAGLCVAVYVVFNILWNVSILLSVKHTGALATFVALKAIFPVSTLLFAYVDWPLLGKSDVSWLVWVSAAIIMPCIIFYQWASEQQSVRAEQLPSQATCCWPLGQ
uniref:EamA domain-containing protein n=1 Tax=Zooxanthella nutricula TaxID=1333877 RepID=A0A7S2NY31_9DINO